MNSQISLTTDAVLWTIVQYQMTSLVTLYGSAFVKGLNLNIRHYFAMPTHSAPTPVLTEKKNLFGKKTKQKNYCAVLTRVISKTK